MWWNQHIPVVDRPVNQTDYMILYVYLPEAKHVNHSYWKYYLYICIFTICIFTQKMLFVVRFTRFYAY